MGHYRSLVPVSGLGAPNHAVDSGGIQSIRAIRGSSCGDERVKPSGKGLVRFSRNRNTVNEPEELLELDGFLQRLDSLGHTINFS